MQNKHYGLVAGGLKSFFVKTAAIVLLLNFSNGVSAQHPLPCGEYKINEEALQKATEYEAHRVEGTQAVSYQVRVYFNIVTNTDGSNAAATLAQVITEYNQLVADYAPTGICFINAGIGYVNNTALNNTFNINTDPSSDFSPYQVPNCLNIFYMKAISGTNAACAGTCGIGGVTLGIPNTFCLVASGNLGQGHSTSHETGHCLGLLHPFDFTHGYEDINESNAATTGDLITDTRADPYSHIGTPCFSITNGAYSGNCQDSNHQTNFSPPYTNLMAYWWASGNYPNLVFTNGQFTRAKSYLSTYGPLINCQSSTSAITEGPNINTTSGYLMASTTSTVTTSGTVSVSGTSIALLAGQSITLQQGFTASPSGVGSILISSAICKSSSTNGARAVENAASAGTVLTGRNALVVYPNPASSFVNIALTLGNGQKNVALQLYDLNGRKVKEINLTNQPAGIQNIPLSVNGFSSGIYYLVIRMDDTMLNAKIVVIR